MFVYGVLIYDLIALFVQAVIEKERQGDFLGKTVQVCYMDFSDAAWLVNSSIVMRS